MMKTILDVIEPILLSAIVGLLGFIAKKAMALPRVLLAFAERFAAEAAKTPGALDDAEATFLVVFARALVAAVEGTLGQRTTDAPATRAPAPEVTTVVISGAAVPAVTPEHGSPAPRVKPEESLRSRVAGSPRGPNP